MMPQKTAIMIYKQTVLPVIEYCGLLYNGLSTSITKRLQHVQNRGLRVCLKTNMKHPVADLHDVCSIDYVDVRCDIQLLMLLHKYLYTESLDARRMGLLVKENNPNGRVMRSTNTMELIYPHDIKLSYR